MKTLVLKANSRISEAKRMPDSNFCLLIDKAFLREDLLLWRSQSKRKVNKQIFKYLMS